MATRTRKPYDPGTPGECLYQGHGVFLVQSHRTEDAYYSVDLHQGTCPCPHAMKRDPEGGCKHYRQAKAEAARRARETARSLSPAQLRQHHTREDLPADVLAAIEEVLIERLYGGPLEALDPDRDPSWAVNARAKKIVRTLPSGIRVTQYLSPEEIALKDIGPMSSLRAA